MSMDFRYTKLAFGLSAAAISTLITLNGVQKGSVEVADWVFDAIPILLRWSPWFFCSVIACTFVDVGRWRALLIREANTKYQTEPLASNDVGRIVDIGTLLIGERHVGAARLQSILGVNDSAAIVLKDRSTGMIAGYYILYPLKKRAHTRIMAAEVATADEITVDDICKSFRRASAIYIAMVAGTTRTARGHAMKSVINEIGKLAATNRTLRALYTRAASKDGQRHMTAFKFRDLPSPSKIQYLQVDGELLQRNEVRKHLDQLFELALLK